MYETNDDLTLVQANKFISIVCAKIGVDYELNEVGPDQYYVFMSELETDREFKDAKQAAVDCKL